jgi:hypothetical protein
VTIDDVNVQNKICVLSACRRLLLEKNNEDMIIRTNNDEDVTIVT